MGLSESAEIPLSACIFLFSLSFSLFSGRFLMSVIQEKDSWFLGIWQQNDVWCVLCCSVPVPVQEASRGEWWSVRMPMDAATATAMRGSNLPSLRAVTRGPALCGTTVFGERWGSIYSSKHGFLSYSSPWHTGCGSYCISHRTSVFHSYHLFCFVHSVCMFVSLSFTYHTKGSHC